MAVAAGFAFTALLISSSNSPPSHIFLKIFSARSISSRILWVLSSGIVFEARNNPDPSKPE
jgi:hypothetical protein